MCAIALVDDATDVLVAGENLDFDENQVAHYYAGTSEHTIQNQFHARERNEHWQHSNEFKPGVHKAHDILLFVQLNMHADTQIPCGGRCALLNIINCSTLIIKI